MKQAGRIPKEKKTRSLRSRTILVLCLFLLPFSIVSIILSLNTLNNLSNTLDTTISAALESYVSQLSGKTSTTDYLLLDTSTNNTVFHQYMNSGEDRRFQTRYLLMQNMNNAIKMSSCADAMFLLHEKWDELVVASRLRVAVDNTRAYLEESEIRSVMEDPSVCDGRWHIVEVGSSVNLFHIIEGTNYRLGAYIDCDDLLAEVCAGLNYPDAQAFLTEENVFAEKNQVLYQAGISHSKVNLVYRADRNTLYGSALVWAYLSIGLFILSVLLIPVFTILFMKHIDRPMKKLRTAFHELETGNQGYRITEKENTTEFVSAENSFNTMADNLETLQRQVLEDEKQQHELETRNLQLQLNNLQLQIRPHFLQNTMNLLFTLIHNQQSENAQRLVLYLSRYFRYMFRYGRDLELLDREMDMVKEYLEISELHYKDAFTVSYQLDPFLSFLRVPPLLIHNFVENIIQHALSPGKTIHIIIYGEYDDEKMQALLQISDDGNGIGEEYADRINRNDFEGLPDGKHIGIRNSINRLKYYYGEEASVAVETAVEGGTTFSIRIPCDLTDIA